jgi:uncharacterized protein (DUF2062 family)
VVLNIGANQKLTLNSLATGGVGMSMAGWMNFRWTMRRLHQWGLSRQKLRGGFLHTRLGDRFLEREIWIPSRQSLARAFLVGVPITMIPFLPLQSVFACGLALWLRANLPVTFLLQHLSNPLTAVIQLPLCYLTGRLILGADLSADWDLVWSDPMGIVSRGSLGALYLGAVVLAGGRYDGVFPHALDMEGAVVAAAQDHGGGRKDSRRSRLNYGRGKVQA